MSTTLEQKVRDGFVGLGSPSKLANGFRQQAKGQQTCAVYFAGNAPGNLVEIGLSPKALAPLLNKPESEITSWIRQQAAITGRERLISGQRGSYPGLAFGSERELDSFLEAWAAFRGRPAQSSGANLLAITKVQKAASDAGFDLTPKQEDGWWVFRASVYPFAVAVKLLPEGHYRVGFSDSSWGEKAAADCRLPVKLQVEEWAAVVEGIEGYPVLHQLLQRAGAIGRVSGKQPLADFTATTQKLPASTEAERLVVQRVGQDIFRKSLIEYWQGSCAVTGLTVVPLLRASHIKPWAECESDAERLDVYNGLLLAPHLDALFDGGWISFSNDGRVIVSEQLSDHDRRLLGLLPELNIPRMTERHQEYLRYHRNKYGFSGAEGS